MNKDFRIFYMGGQWNIVHVPEKPNGFGVLILGDTNHFVDEEKSLWIQHLGRRRIISQLLEEGYTIFYSNLYGTNWGSKKAKDFVKQLYHIVLKQEILNDKIHILVEGMGGLIALQLMEEMPHQLRSVAMINPCLDLQNHLEQEKERRFFFKKLRREIAEAYNFPIEQMDNELKLLKMEQFKTTIPVKIWQTTTGFIYDPNRHCKKFEELRKKEQSPIQLTFHLVEKRYSYGYSICQFFRKYEHRL
ncbi:MULTISPECIES: alpha/beta fold hydrolase [Sutcliffiella]|uniref:AB hydrolase-1 domain-containing protein n=1 Tax=Sutcliffiella cohnii TaxID=33932 RepID=A0A223KM71_9BACI|nr:MULTISPECIES: alpha/beta fold hydrolase [Sutcliffiella]AST90581.1 hypothetical protein BC6307_04450 [Sutcliffiella cohnii]WBL16233.1 hypothetical protein O1A01_06275 [Sutcliffiella sp. NC1]